MRSSKCVTTERNKVKSNSKNWIKKEKFMIARPPRLMKKSPFACLPAACLPAPPRHVTLAFLPDDADA
jgi:hypothetical protein